MYVYTYIYIYIHICVYDTYIYDTYLYGPHSHLVTLCTHILEVISLQKSRIISGSFAERYTGPTKEIHVCRWRNTYMHVGPRMQYIYVYDT